MMIQVSGYRSAFRFFGFLQGFAILAFAGSLDNFANGITRPICGFFSDVIGRENMMLLIFSLESLALFGLVVYGRNPHSFVLFAALVFLFWGEIFVVFPAICGDSFGVR